MSCDTEKIPVFILAGGHSSRFGEDKARAHWRGQQLVCHVRDALLPIASSLTVVADTAERYADLGFSGIADAQAHQGPLGGLLAALTKLAERNDSGAESSPWCLLVACDWVGLRAAWVNQLVAARTVDVVAVAFRGAYWEPCFALYHVSSRPAVLVALAEGNRSMQHLLTRIHATAPPLPPDWASATQINTPQDMPE